jgi:hypothetical protein
MRELARQDEEERQREAEALTHDLGHIPNAIERAVIEQISARVVKARRLRRQGRDDSEQSRLIAQLVRSIGMKPAPAAQTDPSQALRDYLAERYGAPVAQTDTAAEANSEATS